MALLLAFFVAGCSGSNETAVLSSAKAITAYSLAGNAGTISEANKTIAVTVPFATNVTALAATFTTSAGASVKIGATAQVSGTTTNDFTTPKAYIVTAADGSTATYTVTVIVAANSAKAITAYSLAVGVTTVTGAIDQAAKTIAVTVPFGTNVTALVATFTSTGTGVPTMVGVNQVSGTTPNDFTAPKAYIVTAADGSTATYTVTVIVAANTAKAITAFSFVGFAGNAGVITGAASPFAIAVTLPNATPVTALTANFTTTGASVKVGTTVQVSGTTANNFTSPVAYIVTAADGTTATYTVTVTLAAAGTAAINLGTAGNFAILTGTGIGNTPTSVITGNIGVSPTTGASIIVSCAELVTGVGIGEMFTDDATPVAACVSANKTAAGIAVADMGTAYTNASAPATPAGVGAFLELGAGTVTAQTLVPGVYTWAGNVLLTGDITLNGSATDVWIFQIGGTLGTANNIILAGNAKAKNVFWRVADVVTLQGTSQFKGIILGKTSIAMITGATIEGRLLAQTRVDLDANTVTQPAP